MHNDQQLATPAESNPYRSPSHDEASSALPATHDPFGAPGRSTAWRYYVCGLLLLATTINYLDRQTLSATSKRIVDEFALTNEQYGLLELAFGMAFAVGASLFGVLVDRLGPRWIYPVVLLLWSAMGFCTGLVETFAGLLVCRTLLGIFEAGHWPCALKTTQTILPPSQRTFGNSLLQSGTSVGALVTPVIAMALLTPEAGSWRYIFQLVGVAGTIWVVFWMAAIRAGDLPRPRRTVDRSTAGASGRTSFLEVVLTRRFATLVVVVIVINAFWHLYRAWLLLFLQKGRGYSESDALTFNFFFYLSTDIGCIVAGIASVWLTKRGLGVHRSRVLVYNCCALLAAASVAVPWLPAGWPLLGVLLVMGFGGLGLFPCYYAFGQELSTEHQGKVSGTLGSAAWASAALLHWLFGKFVDYWGSYDLGMMAAGLCPLLGSAALMWLWREPDGHA